MPPRNYAGLRAPREALPPSDYTIQRNAIKDAEAVAARVDAKRRADEAAERAKVTQEIAIQQLEIRKAEFRIRQIEKRNEQQAALHKLRMVELNKAREGQFLSELHKLDPTEFASHAKRLALMEKYHGIPELSDFGKDDLSAWDNAMRMTVADEMVKRKAAFEKKAALDEKRANAVADKALAGFTNARTKLAGALAVKADQDTNKDLPPSMVAKTLGEIASLQNEIRTHGERLKAAKPDYATEVDDEIRGIDSFNKLEHDSADAELAALNESKKFKPDAKEIKQARTRLNTWKKVINAPEIVDVTTGEMKPNPFPTKPKSAPVVTAPSVHPVTAPTVKPNATAPVPQDPPDPWHTPDAEAQTSITPATPPVTASPTAPKPVFAPPPPTLSAEPDPWDAVAKNRDAAIAERNKNLDVLTAGGSLWFRPGETAKAADATLAANTKANQQTQAYNDELSRRSAEQSARLVQNLGGQAEYDRMLAEQRAKTAPVAAAPVTAPAVPVAPASVSESDGAQPVAEPKKVIRMKLDKDGNLVPVTPAA